MINITEPLSLLDWEDAYPSVQNAILIIEICACVFTFFGCFGNVSTMIIISKWEKLTSGSGFMFSLALFDLLSVIYDGFVDLFLLFLGYEFESVNDFTCVTGILYSWVTSSVSYYVTVLFSLDKCIAVVFPIKYKLYGKARVSLVATSVVLLLEFVWNFPLVFVFRIDSQWLFQCVPREFGLISPRYFLRLRPLIDSILNGLIPVTLVLILTTITIVKLQLNARKKRRKVSSTKNRNHENEITRQMIVVCLFFGVLCLLHSVLTLAIFNNPMVTIKQQATGFMMFAIVLNTNCLINSANFYIYILFGNNFRSNFMALFVSKTPAANN